MNLLRITSIPLKYTLSIERAQLRISQIPIRAEISKTGGTLELEQKGPEVRMDSFEYRRSVGLKSVRGSNDEWHDRARQDVSTAIDNYVSAGNQAAKIHQKTSFPDIMFSQLMSKISGGQLGLVPTQPIDISWQMGGAKINYQPVKNHFEWNRPRAEMEFVPGSFKMNITQYPSLQIEYLGGPIYVPPSSDPNYQEPAT